MDKKTRRHIQCAIVLAAPIVLGIITLDYFNIPSQRSNRFINAEKEDTANANT